MMPTFRAESWAMSVLSERPDALVGSLLGKVYRVLEPIGVGGMAVVYLVEHQTLLKRFAAKVLSLDLASSLEARARFIQEAHAASQLDHENIVSISDFGTTNDQRPFFVMELLRGQTLDRRLSDGPLSIEEVVAVAVPVARALAHAHAEGVVHLDVKPENIFLVQRTRGRWGVKVVDFGIAKTPLNPRLNKLGETAGSPLYMAPEVCRGDDDVDQRADVYSFGILLYLMMCGRLPFVDDSTQRILQMQLVELPPPPNQINTQLSPELAMVVERALAKHRDDRYPSMEALLYDFAAALPAGADRLLIEAQSGAAAHETPFSGSLSITRPESHARPSSLPPISPLPPRRRNAPMIVIATLVVLGVIGLAAWRQVSGPGGRNRDRTLARSTAGASATVPPSAASAVPGAAPEPAAVTAPAAATPPPAAAAPAAATPPAGGETDPAPAPAADPANGAESAPPRTADPEGIEIARTVAEPAPSAERPKSDRPAAATKKPPVRSKLVTRPVVRPPSVKPPAVTAKTPAVAAKTPAKRAPIVAAAVAAPPATLVQAPEPPSGQTAAGSPIETEVQPDPPAPAPPAPPDAAVVPPPAAPPAPVAAPVKPPPVAVGSLDATPTIVSVEVKGSLSPSIVKRSIERTVPALRSCYRTAARAARSTPAVELRLSFEIDENSLATQVTTSGASFGTLATCAVGVTSQIRTQEAPDVGTAQVTAVIRFRPS
jgi:serine/threonine protein kinase